MRLIAQYPNVGNSGHLFLVPQGQKEGALAIGEKINTQMLSLRKDRDFDAIRDHNWAPETICGQDFILASIPVNQVLSEKGTERVSHVWIALHGLDTKLHQEEIPRLLRVLQDMLSKVPNIITSLGYLESNNGRVIEVLELEDWANQLNIFNLISDGKKQELSSTIQIICNRFFKYKWKTIFPKVFLIMLITLIVCLILNEIINQGREPTNQGHPDKSIIASNETEKKIKSLNDKFKNEFKKYITQKDYEAVKNYFDLTDRQIQDKVKQTDLNKKSGYNDIINNIIKKEFIELKNNMRVDSSWNSSKHDEKTKKIIANLEKYFEEVGVQLNLFFDNDKNKNEFVIFLEKYQSWDSKYKDLVENIVKLTKNKSNMFVNNKNDEININDLNDLTKYRENIKTNDEFLNNYDRLRQRYSNSNRWPTQEDVRDLIKKIIDVSSNN